MGDTILINLDLADNYLKLADNNEHPEDKKHFEE